MFHFHNAERHFTRSGTKQLRTMMSIYQCDLYRGRRLADYLRRSAALIRSSVGDLSCSHRLNVDKEFKLVLSGSGPGFMSKDISTGTLPVRRVGNMTCIMTGSSVMSCFDIFCSQAAESRHF